jgi:hypothetical protein
MDQLIPPAYAGGTDCGLMILRTDCGVLVLRTNLIYRHVAIF